MINSMFFQVFNDLRVKDVLNRFIGGHIPRMFF